MKNYLTIVFFLSSLLVSSVQGQSLVVDDGTPETNIGIGSQLWFANLFTPPSGDYPLNIVSVETYFNSAFVLIGETFDIYLYEDTDGDQDPRTGANLLSSELGVSVGILDAFESHTLTSPVTFSGPNDIIIAIVNRTVGFSSGSNFPAALDQTSSLGRSWVYLDNTIGNPPDLSSSTASFDLIDNFSFPGNWLIRANSVSATAPGIPTLSEWGLLILALLLMTLGTLYLLQPNFAERAKV